MHGFGLKWIILKNYQLGCYRSRFSRSYLCLYDSVRGRNRQRALIDALLLRRRDRYCQVKPVDVHQFYPHNWHICIIHIEKNKRILQLLKFNIIKNSVCVPSTSLLNINVILFSSARYKFDASFTFICFHSVQNDVDFTLGWNL